MMIAELRDMKGTLVLYTDVTEVERRLKHLKSCVRSVPYYDSHSGRIVGVDLHFNRPARKMLLKLANTHQLPLF